MKKLIFLFAFIFVLFSLAIVIAEDNPVSAEEGGSQSSPTVFDSASAPAADSSENVLTETATNQETSENKEIGEKISEEKVELKTEAGITPDNPIYFIKDTYQRITVGDNPEKALNYKEQKIAEAEVMVDKGKPDQAEKALNRALQYSEIVEKETNPQMRDKVQESGAAIENTIKDMEKKTEGDEWKDVREKFDETIKKEKEIGTAAELAAKINELCTSLAQLDPLQYADTCKPKDTSPKWMKEHDKQISAEQEEQAMVFFEKLSQCFESPENCDCKGMSVQKFEDFCLEKSKLAIKCNQGDEKACKEVQSGADPTDLLPDYLVPVLNKVQGKYTKAQYEMYMPDECTKQGTKTSGECSQTMFKLNAPKECLDAGLTGKTKEDEIKCEKIMFEKNAPKECLDAGISSSDSDAPRKCAKIMFMQRSPQECIDAGITGENRDDENKCRQLMEEGNEDFGQRTMSEGGSAIYNRPKFNRDCNKIQDSNEKIKCYEEFYNNAQVQFKEDFVQGEMIDSNTGEGISSEEENARKQCRDKGMDTILEYENGKRIIICVDKSQAGSSGMCQSQNQIERLKQDCKSRGQDANVENRGGCPWVICVGGNYRGDYINEAGRVYAPGTGPNQPPQNIIDQPQQPSQNTGGIKCPDGICDDYEKMNPWACPEDCGGTRQPGNYPQQQPGDYQPPQNIIDQPQQPTQNQENFCSGQAPSCAPNGVPYCQNGNWICPPAPEQPQQQQPVEQQLTTQEPLQEQQQSTNTESSGSSEGETTLTPSPESSPAPATGGETPTPTTGSVITGRVITSVYGDETTRNGDVFLDYWFKR